MKRKRQAQLTTKILVWVVDFLLFYLAMFLAYELRFLLSDILYSLVQNLGIHDILHIPAVFIPIKIYTYIKASVLYSAIMTLVSLHFRAYDLEQRSSRLDEFANAARIAIFGLIITIGICYFFKWFKISRFIVLWSMMFTIILVGGWRVLLYSINTFLLQRGYNLGNIIIYGAGKAGKLLASEILLFSPYAKALQGFVDDDPKGKGKGITIYQGKKLPYLGKGGRLISLCEKMDVSQVFIAMPSISHDKLLKIITILRKNEITFRIMPDVFEVISFKVKPYQIGSITLYSLVGSRLNWFFRSIKRLADFSISFITIAVTSPIWLIIALAIKLDSPGPVFFRQERVGEGNKIFSIFKFRSMQQNAEAMKKHLKRMKKDEVLFKQKDDPRITRVGRFLRKTSLDELPQLLNVLLGHMSIIGPRPLTPKEVERFKPWHYRRLQAPQGITGLPQVRGRSELSFDEIIKLDLFYIENWSLWLDIKILLMTLPSVFTMKGAY